MEIEKVEIHTETISLGQFLKWAGAVETGSHAKELIQEGGVKVNGVVEFKRGRLLNIGDVVECEGAPPFIVAGSPK